ncbi:MAG: hypothetical protein RL135_2317 [Bacteroidota bacterium]|jgi:membrane fusion protein (multidrug efflux system)
MLKTILIYSLAIFSLSGCLHEPHAIHEEGTYIVTLPQIKDTLIYSEYIAQIRAIQHIELRALDEGYLQKIYVDEGQLVQKGQLIFQILPTIYQAEVQKAQAEAEFAKIEYQNTKMLADSSIVSPNELAMVKAHYDKALAELSLAKAHLGFTEIRAPFNGIIGRFKDVRLGSLLEGGELLTTLSDNSQMWVYFNVPESEYLDYALKNKNQDSHQQVDLKMANGQFFELPGKTETIEADFNNETGNIAFRAIFQNPHKILRQGQTGKVYMAKNLHNAILIPQKATFEILDKKYVYIIENSIVKAQEIEVRNELPHLYEVVKGITSSDTLLVDGLRKVKNGETIHTSFKNQDDILKELVQLRAE